MTTRPTTSKVLLVADGRSSADAGPTVPVRRFRLARIVADDRADAGKGRKQRRN